MITIVGTRKLVLLMIVIGLVTLLMVTLSDNSQGAMYGVSFDENEEIHSLSPDHDESGEKTFVLNVENEGEATDMGEVLSLDRSITVPHDTYEHCILIRDINPLEPDVEEHKYYAEGLGVVAELEVSGDERVELISIENV